MLNMIERNSESYLNGDLDNGDLDNVNWNLLTRGKNSIILKTYPEFAEYCNLTKLNGFWWQMLLSIQPQLSIYCDWDKLNGWDWKWLLISQPQFEVYIK